MKKLKYDITRLRTVANFAKIRGVTPPRIHQLVGEGVLEWVIIDGVKFLEV